jgi:hypothetical protein
MKQKGFVLVSVLVITTITTMLAFSQLSDNSLKERIAGNQLKEISARLAAEKGVFDAFDVIADGTAITDRMLTDLNASAEEEDNDYSFLSLDSERNIFVLVSVGEVGGATAHLKAVIKGAEGEAIIACKRVKVWGSGIIDSYSGEPYSATAADTHGDVSVIGGTANIVVGRSGEITGSISEYTGVCDPLGITTLITDIATTGGTARTNYNSADTFSDNNVYVYENFDIKNNDVLITGDVTFYITGNLTTKNTTFTLADNSSLTVFIEGKISVETGSNIFADQSVNADGKTPLTVYSSNTGSDLSNAANADTAVHLSGNASIYMDLYAPLGAVYYKGNGDIMGKIHADVVDISGNGGMHYDQGIGDSASYCAIYYYYPDDNDTPDILDASAYSEYCGASVSAANDAIGEAFCGYTPRSYDDQFSGYKGAAVEAVEAVATAGLAASKAVDLAAGEAIRIAGLSGEEATIATAAVAYEAARMTRCTAYAAAAETRWVATAAAAATVAATTATALGVAEAANAMDAEKTVAAAIANAAAVAAAEAVKAVGVAATAAATAVDVAAAAAHNAAVLAASGAIQVTATPDATDKAALAKAIADSAAAEVAAVAERLANQTAADAKAKSDKILEVAAKRKEALEEIDRLKAIVGATGTSTSTKAVIIPTSTDTQNKNFWTTMDITITTTVNNNGSIIDKITANKLIYYKKEDVTGTTMTTVDENANETETTS